MRSNFWRIALPYVSLILITMLALGVYLASYLRRAALVDLDSKLTAEALMIGNSMKPELASAGANPDFDEQARNWSDVTGARVTIIAPDGTVWGESDGNRLRMDNHSDRPEVKQAYARGFGSSTRFSQTLGYDMRYSAVAVMDLKLIVGVVRVAVPMQQISANLADLQGDLIVIILVVTALVVLLAILIAGYLSRRVG